MLKNCFILIPARKGSKGFPDKNKILFKFTAQQIPEKYKNISFVSTDDEFIKKEAGDYGIKVVERPSEMAQDQTSMREVLAHFVESQNIDSDATVIILYLTYPERKWSDIVDIYEFFNSRPEKSLICCEEVERHPYLCFYEKEDYKAELVVNHDLYRRQDYPKCVIMSMYVACYNPDIISNLHLNMFEDNTIFYKLRKNKVDVDHLKDYENFKQKREKKNV